jgi:peptide/nickel transport system permease protein
VSTASATPAWEAVQRRRVIPQRWRNPIGIAGAVIVGFCILTALFGRFIWTLDPTAPVSDRLHGHISENNFCTDDLGRDTLARVIHGAQVSLQVGAVAISIALVAGTLIGLLAGYRGGVVDLMLMRVVDILFAFPGIVLAIVIAGLLGANRRNAMIAIGVIIVPAFARVVRAAVLEVMGFPFIESARALGGGGLRIMIRHLIPNIIAPLIVLTTVYFSTAILSEATLSFLGLGTQPPEAAWGNMLATSRSYIDQSIWMSIFPGLAIMIVVMGFNFLGDGLRDVLDPRVGGGVGDVVTKK